LRLKMWPGYTVGWGQPGQHAETLFQNKAITRAENVSFVIV
jgi:hypothetical protein